MQLKKLIESINEQYHQQICAAFRQASAQELFDFLRGEEQREQAPPFAQAMRTAAQAPQEPVVAAATLAQRTVPATAHRRVRTPSPATSSKSRRSTGKSGSARNRRASDVVQAIKSRIVDAVNSTDGLLSANQLAVMLKAPKNNLSRPLALAVASGEIKKIGQRRMTRYCKETGS